MRRKSSRIILGYRGKNYKFMSFFVDKRDNSFYFHIYRKPNEFPMNPKTPLPEKSNILRIHFPGFEPTGFEENHISFHKSGCIHSIDSKGHRYRNGTVGIPFSEIESHLFILVLAPKNPSDMLELSKLDSTRDIRIGISDEMQPFALHFGVHKKWSSVMPRLPSNDLLGGYIKCGFDDKDFELLIAMSKVDKVPGVGKVEWPPFTLVLKRIG